MKLKALLLAGLTTFSMTAMPNVWAGGDVSWSITIGSGGHGGYNRPYYRPHHRPHYGYVRPQPVVVVRSRPIYHRPRPVVIVKPRPVYHRPVVVVQPRPVYHRPVVIIGGGYNRPHRSHHYNGYSGGHYNGGGNKYYANSRMY